MPQSHRLGWGLRALFETWMTAVTLKLSLKIIAVQRISGVWGGTALSQAVRRAKVGGSSFMHRKKKEGKSTEADRVSILCEVLYIHLRGSIPYQQDLKVLWLPLQASLKAMVTSSSVFCWSGHLLQTTQVKVSCPALPEVLLLLFCRWERSGLARSSRDHKS